MLGACILWDRRRVLEALMFLKRSLLPKRASGTLVDCCAERQKRPRKRAASIEEIKMRKTLVTILCLALIAASSIQAAAAAEHHHTRKASCKPVMVNDQHRNSNNEQPRDSNVGGMCGIFPGPCQ
jgi:hypothetical protein